jgi:hypothetical protein
LLVTPAGNGHDSSFVMAWTNRPHVAMPVKFIAGSAPTSALPATLKVLTAHIVDSSAGSEPRMLALSISILTIWVLLAPHVPKHAHGSTRALAHFVHDAPPVSSCILIQALHWSAGSSVELLPVQLVTPVPGHDDWPALLVS